MTNVLFVTPDFYPKSTGFANASLNLIEAIKKNGKTEYNIHVFTHIPLGNSSEIDGIKVFRVPRHKTNKLNRLYYDYKRYRLMRDIVINNSIDVIFFETNTFPFVQNWILKDFPNKVFVRIHSTADTEVVVYGANKWYQLKKSKIYSFMNRVPYIISTSNYYLDFIRHNYLNDNVYKVWDNKSYGLLYNTVNVGNSCDKPVMANKFLSMGKMSDNGLTQKGLLDLIRAVYYIKKKNTLPDDFELTIIGNGTQLPTVRAFINKLDLNNYIRIIEQASHEEVLEKIADTKGIILLSRYEGQSMFITESIAMGKPIIISDKNGMQDVLAENKNGYLVKTGDVVEAAEKIEMMINLDKETLDSFGKMSREIYLDKFSDEKVYRQFDNIMKTRY
jgi:glycosyltransferase involved in cell wall biosynthesis